MDEFKFHNKIKNIFYYILFLFAFVCVGFTFNSSKVDAAVSVDIKDTIDYTNKKVSFDAKRYIGSEKHFSKVAKF